MGSATITNLIATHVKEEHPSTNYNSYPKLPVRDFTNTDVNSYIYFNRPFPLGATIVSAKLIWFSTGEGGSGTRGWRFTRLAAKFDASKLVYNNRPTTFISGDKDVTAALPWADKRQFELDFADWMQTIANGGPWYGLRVIPTTFENNVLWMYSELWTDATLRPRVEITWSDAPSTPSGLSPGGGRVVGLAKPIVKAQYVDVSGLTALQAIQVQIDAANDFTTGIDFDSGTVLTSVPELNLASTAYAGLADGATTYWRVRFQDAAGLWSAWSASTSFKRDDKGTLTLNNPPL